MSGDEVFALIGSIALGLFGWSQWIFPMLNLNNPGRKTPSWIPILIAPGVSIAVMLFVLRSWSSYDVQSDLTYIFFYLVMWFGWTGACLRLLPYLELNCRDDVLERLNPAAALAVAGALVGITFAFAGGNIGDGPGWWVVFFSAGLSTGTLLLLWAAGHVISGVEEAITVDRDVASGWRALGFFVGGGLVVGRAAAGDWVSAGGTVEDFISKGFLVVVLWGIAIATDILFRPSIIRPHPPVMSHGVMPGLLQIAMGLGIVLLQGDWK